MQKETSSSERIIAEPIIIEFGKREDINIKGGGQVADMEMGQIRLKTMVDIGNITEACSPCLAMAYSAGIPC